MVVFCTPFYLSLSRCAIRGQTLSKIAPLSILEVREKC